MMPTLMMPSRKPPQSGAMPLIAPKTMGTHSSAPIISTIAVATSAITTTLVIVAGVVLLVPLQPVLQNPVLQPAFNNVVPALFGALGMQYFSKSLKLTAGPLTLMSLLCIFIPSLASQTSTMMLPCGAFALVMAYFLWKKDKL